MRACPSHAEESSAVGKSIQELPKTEFPKGGTVPYISFPRTLAQGPKLVLLYKAEPAQQTN